MKKFLRMFLSAVTAASLLAGAASAEDGLGGLVTDGGNITEDSPQVAAPDIGGSESAVYLPNGMRAVTVTPETDFERSSELAEMYDEIRGYGMNAVIINSSGEDGAFYNLELTAEGRDILNDAIDGAHGANLGAYITLSARDLVETVKFDGGGLMEGFSAAAHKFAMKYRCEGIILTDYYTADTEWSYAEYLRSGSGIGYENWLYETNRYIFRTISEAVRRTSNSTAFGVLIEDMWANASSNEEGSDTEDTVQALYDGHCDTKRYIEEGYADFVFVKAYGSTNDYNLNFESVVGWWYELGLKNNVKTYVCHLNERIGDRWSEDQLLRQLTVMEDMDELGGSVFNSLSALRDNVLNSRETLIEYFNDQINKETLFEDLEMVSPTQLTYSTFDSTAKFMGTFDPNFDVYFDGQKIVLNDVGNFYIPKELDVGWNYFTIEHKGKKYNYSIEHTIRVLYSIDSTADITVEGGTQLSFTAIAYSGSYVTATLNGTTIELKEMATSENVDANGTYSQFVGYYTVPAGIVGQAQHLGTVNYYASYSGYEESMYGITVTVAAKPEPPKTDIKVDLIPDQSVAGTGEVVGNIDPIYTEDDYVTYVKTIDNFTDVLDAKTTGKIPSPMFSQMPANTLDYYKSSADGFVITTSGKRYRSEYVTTFDDTGLGYNALTVNEIGNSGGKSYIKLSLDHKTSFNVTTSQSFVQGYEGPYGVVNFNAQYVYITFDNVTSVTKLPSFDYCTLFSAGEWETVTEDGIPKFRMRLTLSQAGIYSGVSARYDDNGDLVLKFSVPTPTLSGKTIVLDPGHGYDENNKFDPGAIGEVTEQSITLAVTKKLEQILTDMGANVIRLQTESEGIGDRDRPRRANWYDADMCMSIHCNSSTNTSAHGCEVYYFTPWSQTLAKGIHDNMVSFFDSVYSDGTDSARGDKYSYYWYTLEQSFPSVLVEMGFVSNQRECLIMANDSNQTQMAQAIANGIYQYFARSGLSY
ncbi:MAG: N-acetylmuramoyl-L-alanine amidase [Lachnospiraceae bacterium]|nr:N-acetylmuramoyl-L-alanine amidase [Ruminococcus sp.]MCM1274556.1 N-acetylmuramoyl-L-alanine amidase [Lachnospiraceae bacterium]